MLEKEKALIDRYIDNVSYESEEYELLENIKETLEVVESISSTLKYYKPYNLT